MGKESTDRCIIKSISQWTYSNPPPCWVLLMVHDKDFGKTMQNLKIDGYGVLLISKEQAPPLVQSAATKIWDWNDILEGNKLSGKIPENFIPKPIVDKIKSVLKLKSPEDISCNGLLKELKKVDENILPKYYGFGSLSRMLLSKFYM